MPETEHVRRVLIIEDNDEAATALANLLAAAGYEVKTVCDGDSALVAAEAFHQFPDVLLNMADRVEVELQFAKW